MAKRRTRRTGARWTAAVVALGAVTALPGAAAAQDAPDAAPWYVAAEDAVAVEGQASSSDGPELTPGRYTDAIGPGETKFYSLALDDTSTAYLAATVAPKPGTTVASFGEEIEVRLTTTDGQVCDTGGDGFAGDGTAYPVSDYAARRIGGGIERCQKAGPYLFQVTRDNPETADPADWPVEISYLSEPGLTGAVPGPPGNGADEDEEPPPPPTGTPKEAHGGTGFNDAGSVGAGVWKDRLEAGQTRFYRVPLDWGQRLHALAELPNGRASDEASGFVSKAVGLHTFDPARGDLASNFQSFTGAQTAVGLSTGVVEYGARFADKVPGPDMAGWSYLAVTLHQDLAPHFPSGANVTLRVTIEGEPKEAPAYDRDAVAAGFGVTDADRDAAAKGLTAAEAAEGDTRQLIAVAGIGTGSVLVLGLLVWWLLARRRAGAAAVPSAAVGGYGHPQPGYGPAAGSWPPPGDGRGQP
ncbi:hypothetical protein V1J52_17885 [Streptomyces sp. TRM 70351]|uniref:hypothetical protein n=1 Tax=Streptomyces sp. TRM 70351 TaxID=3116552 RepID=UPI002E7B0B23|nr:hypothetical protein [Streptomyces sp. TRM 70351]MEE1930033.1 hypothetical protein [Streptomyces sp. TRM 70351]